jgi:hypothetical protein
MTCARSSLVRWFPWGYCPPALLSGGGAGGTAKVRELADVAFGRSDVDCREEKVRYSAQMVAISLAFRLWTQRQATLLLLWKMHWVQRTNWAGTVFFTSNRHGMNLRMKSEGGSIGSPRKSRAMPVAVVLGSSTLCSIGYPLFPEW